MNISAIKANKKKNPIEKQKKKFKKTNLQWNIHSLMGFSKSLINQLFFFPSFKLNLEKKRVLCGQNKETLEHFMLNLSQLTK